MELQKSLLKNVDTDLLSEFLAISTSVAKSEVLNFKINNESLSGIANNEGDSIYKKWDIKLVQLCESHDEIPSLKCSIYKGDEFIKKILSYFGKTVNINLFHNDGSVRKLELYKTDEKGRTMLKITVLGANVETAYIDYNDEVIGKIFDPSDESLAQFSLDAVNLQQVSKYSKLQTNPEKQTEYVRLYTNDGCLNATDNAFDVILHETDVVLTDDVEIDKSLWQLIDEDQYDCSIHSIDQNRILVCSSTTKDVKITLVLLSKVDSSQSFDSFESFDEAF